MKTCLVILAALITVIILTVVVTNVHCHLKPPITYLIQFRKPLSGRNYWHMALAPT